VFVANLVLTQRGSFREASLALRGAQWMWLPALVAASTATYAMAAITLSAATRQHLRLRRTVAVQVAGAFTNRLAPGGLGGMATNVRYLERCGLERADALSAVSITWAAGVFVHVCIVITVGLLFWFSVGDAYQPNTPPGDYWPVIGGILVVLFAGGLVVRRCLRSRATAFVAKIRDNLADLRQRPHHLRRLLASSAGMTCSHTFALVISLQAFGGGVALVNIAIVYLAATGVAAAIPTPGGVGTLETALAAGLVDARTPSGTAMAAVLTYRLTTFWLPIIPGAVTFRILRRRRVL
jgi:undecaprenyl-diphosphatase